MVAVCAIVPVAAIVPVFPSGTHRHYREEPQPRVFIQYSMQQNSMRAETYLVHQVLYSFIEKHGKNKNHLT